MEITFLGTAAANAFPEAFCRCANCVQARVLGGPSLRKRSAALVNDDLLIDFGPDVLTASWMHHRPFTNVRYCLQTHAHADHLDPSHFFSRSPDFGVVGAPRLQFYASAGTLRVAAQLLERDCGPHGLLAPETADLLNMDFHTVAPLQPFSMGNYQVIAFKANHDPFVEPLLYSIEADGRTIFYGTDTSDLPEETWQGFHDYKRRFDLVILDHTYGTEEIPHEHLSASRFLTHMSRMREEGLLTENTRVFATHISHSCNPVHPELVKFSAERGYEVAYDGLTV